MSRLWILLAATAFTVSGAAFIGLSQLSTEDLISCSQEDSPMVIPSSICRQYTLLMRTGPEDIERIRGLNGVAYILAPPAEGKFEIAERYLEKGLDVNAEIHTTLNVSTFTALHMFATFNEPSVVAFLLEHGADKSKRDSEGRTPLQGAEQQQDREPKSDFSQVIKLLR
ncbi:ankyrin repeat domain-containing protein [Pseudomonas sp. RIT-PI-AD]|uniref:ankyrin repeat domain-containing protein n=1 Tax=Pseudomonas sp. RIT-PI-AD TaxID=3035294 RepID=UPI0021DABB4F|nr:ankyrin repeat domain-containing protein [Pseudomonas sp. RIT-PI-AD]